MMKKVGLCLYWHDYNSFLRHHSITLLHQRKKILSPHLACSKVNCSRHRFITAPDWGVCKCCAIDIARSAQKLPSLIAKKVRSYKVHVKNWCGLFSDVNLHACEGLKET